MPVFKCAKCGCVENAALGLYWARWYLKDALDWSGVGTEYKGLPLCSECAPGRFLSGKPTKWGKWHGRFKKEPYDEERDR